MSKKYILIRGAREHNLQNITLKIPREKFVVITGVSGSGKSSLAFDTLYAEGQRRYVESLSAYARQFLETMRKPDVDHIEGLSPAISIDQKTTSRNPRSTVGTVTEIHDYLRLLFARAGTPYSPATGLPIQSQTVSEMTDQIMALGSGTRLQLLAPIIRGRKGEFRREFADLIKKGFQRVIVDGQLYPLEEVPELDRNYKHEIDVVVDRLVVKDGLERRLAESIETAVNLSDGLVAALTVPASENNQAPQRILMSARFACPVSGFTLEEIEPRLFSFNSPKGACPNCDGLGIIHFIDPDLIIPDPTLSLHQGAVAPWSKTNAPYYMQTLEAVVRHYDASLHTPWNDLPENTRHTLLHGSGKEAIAFSYDTGRYKRSRKRPFEGVATSLERRRKETESAMIREEIERYLGRMDCPACHGTRLKPEALCVKIDELSIANIASLTIAAAQLRLKLMASRLNNRNRIIATPILREIMARLDFLNHVGLDYLSLSRASATLSGGESQRIRLASQIGSGLTGVLYVLDEPSIGLHHRDNRRLIETLQHLRDLGNSVIVVEHDEEAIRSADFIVDIGPEAGNHGGHVVASGALSQIIKAPQSITGRYLAGDLFIPLRNPRIPDPNKSITLKGAQANNLKTINISIPLGAFCCVTGVSGSGKSSLIIDILYPAIARQLNRSRIQPGPYDQLDGLHNLDKVIEIDQSPIGRTPRSNPATYIGAFTPIREWFTGLPESRARGYKPGRFSFNVRGGRCEACQGDGLIKIEMHFLPDVYVTCEQCRGKRYNRETLDIHYRDKNIADILAMTIEAAVAFFPAIPAIHDKLIMLQHVGLGYITIGQAATTLSGGEAQRIKLARELSRRATGRTLYILDEPTTGLHTHDIRLLLDVLHELVDQGNTVIVIEHNLDVIKTADYIIDLGPEGGHEGGYIVATGTPQDIAQCPASYTGHVLASTLKRYAQLQANADHHSGKNITATKKPKSQPKSRPKPRKTSA